MRGLGRKPPSLNWLHAFEVAARHGSFARAAKEMNVSQTAVSRMVRVLENHLGYQLFDRSANALTLTARGKLLLPGISKAFSWISTLLTESGNARPILTVGVGVTFSEHWLIPRLSRYAAQFPDTEIRLAICRSRTPLKPEWSCAIRSDDYYTEDFVAKPFLSAGLVAVCTPQLARQLKTVADLRDAPLLRVTAGANDWPIWLQAAGVSSDGISMKAEFDTYAMAVEAASHGMGVALAFEPYFAKEIEAGLVVAPFDLRLPKNRQWMLVYRRENGNQPELLSFFAWLKSEVAAGNRSPHPRIASRRRLVASQQS